MRGAILDTSRVGDCRQEGGKWGAGREGGRAPEGVKGDFLWLSNARCRTVSVISAVANGATQTHTHAYKRSD